MSKSLAYWLQSGLNACPRNFFRKWFAFQGCRAVRPRGGAMKETVFKAYGLTGAENERRPKTPPTEIVAFLDQASWVTSAVD
jgi:hypothetical protein